MNTRPEDWPARLHAFLEQRNAQPFAWGRNDCALTACDWVLALTGSDPGADFRGRYRTKIGAARLLIPRGGLLAVARDYCAAQGWPECPVPMARRGDLVSIKTLQGPALGVCVGAQAAFAGPEGLSLIPLNQCQHAWRIA